MSLIREISDGDSMQGIREQALNPVIRSVNEKDSKMHRAIWLSNNNKRTTVTSNKEWRPVELDPKEALIPATIDYQGDFKSRGGLVGLGNTNNSKEVRIEISGNISCVNAGSIFFSEITSLLHILNKDLGSVFTASESYVNYNIHAHGNFRCVGYGVINQEDTFLLEIFNDNGDAQEATAEVLVTNVLIEVIEL